MAAGEVAQTAASRERLSNGGEDAMLARIRCDHCDAILGDVRVERDRKRFCCVECARAFDRGELKSISPHVHETVASVGSAHFTARPGR